MHSDIDRNQYYDILSTRIGQHYDKKDPKIFETLLPNIDKAIKHARRLMQNYPAESPPSQKAPATNFYELVEHLRGYLEPIHKLAVDGNQFAPDNNSAGKLDEGTIVGRFFLKADQ